MSQAADCSGKIEIGRALPAEYPIILNNLPPEWLASHDAYQMHLQVADMVSASRFLIAQVGQRLIGGVGWQDNIAYGALYSKFIFVDPEYHRAGVAVRLLAEVIRIAKEQGKRAVFADIPEKSPFGEVADEIPGLDEVGYIDGFHEAGVRSRIFAFNLKQYDRLQREAARRTNTYS
jgi:GNAT superfamily N-acetyltransferase